MIDIENSVFEDRLRPAPNKIEVLPRLFGEGKEDESLHSRVLIREPEPSLHSAFLCSLYIIELN